jgi:ATP-binding cassette subfamily B protein
MGGKNAGLMAEYQAAQDRMSKAGVEYVRGIPVVKVFQQTVYSFKAFKEAIEDYSKKAGHYQGEVCRMPQTINLTVTEGAFMFLVPVALVLAPGALESGDFAGFVTDFAFYAVFSAIISRADGPHRVRVPEQPPVQDVNLGKRSRRAPRRDTRRCARSA